MYIVRLAASSRGLICGMGYYLHVVSTLASLVCVSVMFVLTVRHFTTVCHTADHVAICHTNYTFSTPHRSSHRIKANQPGAAVLGLYLPPRALNPDSEISTQQSTLSKVLIIIVYEKPQQTDLAMLSCCCLFVSGEPRCPDTPPSGSAPNSLGFQNCPTSLNSRCSAPCVRGASGTGSYTATCLLNDVRNNPNGVPAWVVKGACRVRKCFGCALHN